MLFYTRSCNEYFYEGTAGIAFFLTKVASISHDLIISETAKGALQQLINNKESTGIGFYTGLTGLAFAMKEAGNIFENKEYHTVSKQWVKQITQINPAECKLDVAEGIAGDLPVLIQLQSSFKDKQLGEFIVSLADYLLQKRNEHAFGWSWSTLEDTTQHLTGFGHGAAGIGHAFTCMFRFSKEKKYAEAVAKAFDYENYFFDKAQMNWPDFRKRFTGTNETICSLAWCHGAPGIGMARLYAEKILGNQAFIDDALKAVETTQKFNSLEALSNLSLCHGLTGNTELLLQASLVLNESQLLKEAETIADSIISKFIAKKTPLPGGVGNANETPGFMTGNSGIGYFLLRMYQPDLFSSLLLPGLKD
jgi:lantibiotic modifying enzyme